MDLLRASSRQALPPFALHAQVQLHVGVHPVAVHVDGMALVRGALGNDDRSSYRAAACIVLRHHLHRWLHGMPAVFEQVIFCLRAAIKLTVVWSL